MSEFKMIRTFLFASLVFGCSSCQILGPENEAVGRLEVHLQASFENTSVQIWLNARQIYDDIATTDHRIGLADVVYDSTVVGVHHLHIAVDEQYFLNTSITLGPELYVGVQFDGDTIQVTSNRKGFVYF